MLYTAARKSRDNLIPAGEIAGVVRNGFSADPYSRLIDVSKISRWKRILTGQSVLQRSFLALASRLCIRHSFPDGGGH